MSYLTKKRYESLIFILIFLFLTIVILSIILAFKGYKYDVEKNYLENLFAEINNNFNQKLIYSFRLNNTCSSDEEWLILGKWEGKHLEINYTFIESNYICVKKSEKSYKGLLQNNQIIKKMINAL